MESLRKPAIKSGMGKWTYYASSMTYAQLAEYVKMPKEVCNSEILSQRIQRDLSDKHVKNINSYLQKEDDRFFNALVLAVYGGKPSWYPGMFEMDGTSFYNIGILELSGDEKIFPVDGQHRLAAIKDLVLEGNIDENEEVPVIFISHEDSEAGIERMRRLFTSLNRYAKPVNEAEKIILDEDDIVAIITRYFTDDCSFFGDKVLYSKSDSMNPMDKTHFINIRSLYKCNDFLLTVFLNGAKTSEKEDYKRYRKSDEEIEKFKEFALLFWKTLASKMPDIKAFFDKGEITYQRSDKGGSLLFRPRGICPFVEAITTICMKKNIDYDTAINFFVEVDCMLDSKVWKDVLWNGEIIDPGQALIRDMFVYMYDSSLLTGKRIGTIVEKISEKKHITEEEAKKLLSLS